MKYTFLLVFVFSILGLRAQDKSDLEMKPFFVGVTAGGYFANKNTAYFYNGNASGGIERVLNTQFYADQITQEYQSYPWTFGEFPEQMRYTVAAQLGIHLGYNVSETFSLIGDLDLINIKAQDFITLLIDDPNNLSPEPTIEVIPILGKEKRLSLNFGFQNYLSSENNTYFYWSLAANVSITKFEDNTMKIGSLPAMYIGDPLWIGNINVNNGSVVAGTGRTKPGGVGVGAIAGFGVKFKFNPQFIFDIGYNLHYTTVNLTDYDSVFKERGMQHSLFARIIWG
ncbi:MAG: hypothetical protein ACI9J3_000467 [Parvicellaceae bacterium]|jgi:hypothetical protein